MEATTQLLEATREAIKAVKAEIETLKAAEAALAKGNGAPAAGLFASTTTTAPSRVRITPTPTTKPKAKRGRPKKDEPSRADEFVKLAGNGGTTIYEAAERLGIKPNYLYRLSSRLTKQGLVKRDGDRYVAA